MLPGGNQVDDFKIIFTYACFLDEITITTEITNWTYVFSANPLVLTPTTAFSQKLAGCIKTYKLEIYSDSSQAWKTYVPVTSGHDYFISNWDSTTGTITVLNSSGMNGGVSLKPSTQYKMRISLTSDFATTNLKTATDEFTLTLQDGCYNNQIKMDASLANSSGGVLIPDQTYKVTIPGAPTPSIVLVPLYSTSISPASCPL
jgi:hypothetical protein